MAHETLKQIQVRRDDLETSQIAELPRPTLAKGEVLATVDRFALTANNVSYGVSGDTIGYWRYFPAEEPWGVIPVWGFAKVIESRCREVPVGDRIWGFLPMASHVVLAPAQVDARGYVDGAEHRKALPEIYNRYQRTANDLPALRDVDVERCALFPLFTTSYVIADFLNDNDWFGAEQVLILSASSKTGFGLADMLRNVPDRPVRVLGATSASNRTFVDGLGLYDDVLVYDEISRLDASVATVVVDMAGSAAILSVVHRHFRDRLTYSCVVGATHWTARGGRGELPGPKPAFFFAPGQIAKREAEWGAGEILRRAQQESLEMALHVRPHMEVEEIRGADACKAALDDMVAGRVSPRRILMLGLAPTLQ